MATSGSWDYSLDAAAIINMALENIGVLAPGATVVTAHQTMLLRRLNVIAKQFQGNADMAQGLKVHTRQRLVIFPVANQIRYAVGSASSDDRASVNSLATTLGAAKALNATSITVTSTTGMTAADIIGFVTTAGPIGWGTISTVDSATGLTIAANSIGAAASGNVVYTYTSKAQRFVVIEYATLRDNSQAGQPIDLPMTIYTDAMQYESLPQKFANGDPLSVLVEPTRLNTIVTCNFAPTSMYKTLRLTVLYPAEDYDATSNDIAFPQEWLRPLAWELASEAHSIFGRAWTPKMELNRKESLSVARELNPDNRSAYFQPERDQYELDR